MLCVGLTSFVIRFVLHIAAWLAVGPTDCSPVLGKPLFMWQDDILLVLLIILTHAEKECIRQLALLWGTRHFISPELAGKDVMVLLLLFLPGTQDRASRQHGHNWELLSCMQILGGNGYINEYPTGRLLRDAKLYEIGAGT